MYNISNINDPKEGLNQEQSRALVRVPQPAVESKTYNDIYATLPLDSWGDELAALTPYYPCIREIFNNVHPHKKPAMFFSAGAMFGTLMTRTWYHFWHDPEIVRRLNYSIFIIGDPGAGKNAIERLFYKICEPIINADQLMIDEVNKYKEERTARGTSTKAQKGDALKRPVVGIRFHPARTSTGEFIRHMLAAKEEVEGQPMFLHMLSFDSELENAHKHNKGGDWKDRESLELKAFHNETDGQMFAHLESVTGNFNVYWNFVYTGTPYALHRKVNQKNFGTGLSTRLAVIPMPDRGIALRYQHVDPNANDTLRMWAYRLDKMHGELPLEALNDETFDWQTPRMEIAEFNEDRAERMLLKRIPYYGINISLPFIVMRHWDEWEQHQTLTMDETDQRLCHLVMDIQYKCQKFFFGEMTYTYFEDMHKNVEQHSHTTHYEECFSKLPEVFKATDVMSCFGVAKSSAHKIIDRFKKDKVIEKEGFGVYKKLFKELP